MLHSAAVHWTGTGSVSFSNGLQEDVHRVPAGFLQERFLCMEFAEEAEEGGGGLLVLAAAGAGPVWRTSGLSQLGGPKSFQVAPCCRSV